MVHFTAFASWLQKCRHLQASILSLCRFSVPLLPGTLIRPNFFGADLYGAKLGWADLRRVNLSGADLREVDLGGADLNGVNLRETSMAWTIVRNVDLSTVEGLDTVKHRGPSTIGIDTLYRSQGIIPEKFLRGVGVPDAMVTYVKSLVGQPFQYYSCFISYSSRDKTLAQRLHADLQDKGVRCWFAPEDLKIGDEFRSRIDESIQVYERLLLILALYQHSCHQGQSSACQLSSCYSAVLNNASCRVPLLGL
jgi:uncharacterized protein YjbI with pentapeptide repeats